MARTYQNLLAEAREIIQDTSTDPALQRYSDQTLLDILNRGLTVLYSIRPDAFYDVWDNALEDFVVPNLTLSTWTGAFGLPQMFYPPLVNYVIGLTESIDDEFTVDARSTQFMNAFKAAVVSL